MGETKIGQTNSQQFEEIKQIIGRHRATALREVNHELVLSAWEVGGYISQRMKKATWGSQTVKQLSEYLCKENPSLRGYSRRHLYNMVEFYDGYSSPSFEAFMQRWPQLSTLHKKDEQPVQSLIAQTNAIPQFLLKIPFTNREATVKRNVIRYQRIKIVLSK